MTPDTTPAQTAPVTTEPSPTAQLAALAAAGSFVEQRISRGQHGSSEMQASDEIMAEIAGLLKPKK